MHRVGRRREQRSGIREMRNRICDEYNVWDRDIAGFATNHGLATGEGRGRGTELDERIAEYVYRRFVSKPRDTDSREGRASA